MVGASPDLRREPRLADDRPRPILSAMTTTRTGTQPQSAEARVRPSSGSANPTPDELWNSRRRCSSWTVRRPPSREVAHAFHSCLRTLEQVLHARRVGGAVLGTAAVASVSLPECATAEERGLGELLERALPAVLEVGAALQSAEAWEIEPGLIYDEFAWFLYEELWDISLGVRTDLTAVERRQHIDQILDPLLDPDLPGQGPGHARRRRLPIGPRRAHAACCCSRSSSPPKHCSRTLLPSVSVSRLARVLAPPSRPSAIVQRIPAGRRRIGERTRRHARTAARRCSGIARRRLRAGGSAECQHGRIATGNHAPNSAIGGASRPTCTRGGRPG